MADELRLVLHIDDEPDLRDIVAMTLEMLGGYSVRSCASGSEGIAMARMEQPDLVILDVMMPVLDGPKTLAALRADPGTRDIPVVFMTAKVMPSEIARLRGLGACAVIAKPFDPAELCARLREIWSAVLRERAAAAPPLAPETARSGDAPNPCDDLARRFVARARTMNDELAALSARSGRDALDQDAIGSNRSNGMNVIDSNHLERDCREKSAPTFSHPALERMHIIAHTLAGSGGTFGYAALSQAAAELEDTVEEILLKGDGENRLAPALEKLRARLTSLCDPQRVQAAP